MTATKIVQIITTLKTAFRNVKKNMKIKNGG